MPTKPSFTLEGLFASCLFHCDWHLTLSSHAVFRHSLKVHLRQLVGGAQGLPNERLFEAVYPERVGQLHRLLQQLSPRWNITLLHFRKTGAAAGVGEAFLYIS